jgi:hypothetical protein
MTLFSSLGFFNLRSNSKAWNQMVSPAVWFGPSFFAQGF